MITNSIDMPLPHPWINQTSAPRAVILLYHRIGKSDDDPLLLSVSAQNFSDHLHLLKEAYNPIKLSDLPEILQAKQLPPKTVIITVDDGYRDLLSTALPLLQNFDINATAFMCGSNQNEKPEFWWDTLQNIFLRPGRLPETLEIDWHGQRLQWELGELSDYSPAMAMSSRSWTMRADQMPNLRQSIFKQFHQLIRTASEPEIIHLMDKLKTWSRFSFEEYEQEMLSRQEISDLTKSGHLELGGHTVSHPFLTGLPAAEQQKQITQNKDFLESISGSAITSFAYPYGSEADYNPETIGLVQECGYKIACSSNPDVVWTGSYMWTLPRIMVRNCNGETFARWLENWL